jgi:hypothetical protein
MERREAHPLALDLVERLRDGDFDTRTFERMRERIREHSAHDRWLSLSLMTIAGELAARGQAEMSEHFLTLARIGLTNFGEMQTRASVKRLSVAPCVSSASVLKAPSVSAFKPNNMRRG